MSVDNRPTRLGFWSQWVKLHTTEKDRTTAWINAEISVVSRMRWPPDEASPPDDAHVLVWLPGDSEPRGRKHVHTWGPRIDPPEEP